MPDQRWLLDALASLNSNHRFFQKSYHPDRQVDAYGEVKLAYLRGTVDLSHPVFLKLPMQLLTRKKCLKGVAPAAM